MDCEALSRWTLRIIVQVEDVWSFYHTAPAKLPFLVRKCRGWQKCEEQVLVEQVLVEQVLVEQVLVEQVLVEQVLVEQVLVEQVLVEQVLVEQVLVEQVLVEQVLVSSKVYCASRLVSWNVCCLFVWLVCVQCAPTDKCGSLTQVLLIV